MLNLQRSSASSASCRLEWRPSAWLIAALPALGVLGALSLLLSGFPRALTWTGALLALLWGVVESRREAAKSPIDSPRPAGTI